MLKKWSQKDNNAATMAIRSGGWAEVDHTQCFSKALHKGDIRIQANCKQASLSHSTHFMCLFLFS